MTTKLTFQAFKKLLHVSEEMGGGSTLFTFACYAAFRQITEMWWGARTPQSDTLPPTVPLKYFTFSLSGKDGKETIGVEVQPGLDDWAAEVFEEKGSGA